MLGDVGVVLLGVVCVRNQVTPWVLRSLVGTAAVVGVRLTTMPESMASEMVPVFAVLATALAVMITTRVGNFVGSGRIDGAVNVAVPVVCSFERVPRDPSVGQVMAVAGFGFGVVVVAGGVVV